MYGRRGQEPFAEDIERELEAEKVKMKTQRRQTNSVRYALSSEGSNKQTLVVLQKLNNLAETGQIT